MDFNPVVFFLYLLYKMRYPEVDSGSENVPDTTLRTFHSFASKPTRHPMKFYTEGQGVPIEDFIPFGVSAGDRKLRTEDDAYERIPLSHEPFLFFNSSYSQLYLNTNGGISFTSGVTKFTPDCGTMNQPMIVPFWADVDTTRGGEVTYRQTMDATVLSQVQERLQAAFPSTGSSLLKPLWAFVTTWNEVAFFGALAPTPTCPGRDIRNTFQALLIRTEEESFVIFLYNKIQWTTGTQSGGGNQCTGLGGQPAKAGFDYGDGSTFYNLPSSCTADVPKIATTSNTGQGGKWAFRVTHAVKERDCDVECGKGDTQFLVDPFDCHSYYHCSNGVPIRHVCAIEGGDRRLVFDPRKGLNTCVWNADYACQPLCEKV